MTRISEFQPEDHDPYEGYDDPEPDTTCQCAAMHDDLEHAENLCSACGCPIIDIFAPVQIVASKDGK